MKKFICIFLCLLLFLTASGCQPTASSVSSPTHPIDDFAEAEIRSALGLLLDREYIVSQIAQGGQTPASSFVPLGMTDADGSQFCQNAGHSTAYAGYFDPSTAAYSENFSQAIRILRKYYAYDESTGKFLNFPTLTYLYNNADSHRAVGEYMQNIFAGVGITLHLENQEWNTFLNTRKQGDYTLARNGWVADYNDPICFLDMWTSDSGNNDVQLGKGAHRESAIYDLDLTAYGMDIQVQDGTWAQTYDVLIDAIKNTTDPHIRYEMMHLAEDMLMETGCIMPLYYYADLYMLDSRVSGFYANHLGCKYFQKTAVDGKTDSISVCLASESDSLDPALNSTVDGATLLCHLFSGLARWDSDPNGVTVPVADCAQDLPQGEVQEDGSVIYTYTLQEGLSWSDGKKLVASDFVYAWNRAASDSTGSGQGYLFRVIEGYEEGKLSVSAPDDRTLIVTLKKPIGYWNELLALPAFFPVRQDIAEAKEGWATGPADYICNGPYTMAGWSHNSVIKLRKNQQYHNLQGVTMDNIAFYLSDDANNMLSNFKNGTWQLIDQVPTNEIPSLKAQYPSEFLIAPQLGTYYLCWNVNASLSTT